MSSTGQALGYVVGAVAGYFTGGTSYILMGAAIGGAVGSALDPPKGPKITGPRLSDLAQQTSSYGAAIPRIYGSVATLGNIFWIENNALKEHSHTSGGGKGGGGGSETTTYSYTATFAVGLCEGPIVGVRRIWAMGKLIYDAGTDDVAQMIVNNSVVSGFKVYYGTDTQQPDPRMQAAVGAANCPAYRGLAYIVFYDFDLTDYGNSLMGAQIKVEVMTALSDDPVTIPQMLSMPGAPLLYKATALYCSDDGTMRVYSSLTGAGVAGKIQPYDYTTAGNAAYYLGQLDDDGYGDYFVQGWSDVPECIQQGGSNKFYVCASGAPIYIGKNSLAGHVGFQLYNYHRRNGLRYLCIQYSSLVTYVCLLSGETDNIVLTSQSTDSDGLLHDIFLGENYYYGVTIKPALICWDKNWNKLWSVDMAGQFSINNSIGGHDALVREKADGEVVVRCNFGFWIVNQSGYAYLGSCIAAAPSFPGYENHGGDHLIYPLWIHYNATENKVYCAKLDGSKNATVTLGSIVQAESLKSNVLSAIDLNTSSLVDAVRGYRISSVAAIRAGIEPLQGAFPFDALQAGYQIKFVRRGSASSVATIPFSDLVKPEGKSDTALISMPREMDTQLPWRVSVTHLDYEREYDQGEQYAERLNTKSVNITTQEMAVVMTADEAARVADSLLYLYWMERSSAQFSIPPSYRALEPCDVITVSAFGGTQKLRIKEITYEADGSLAISAVYAGNAVYSSTLSGGTASVSKAPVSIQGPTTAALLDIPLLRDQDNLAGFPVALCGYSSGWRGATLFKSDDGGQSWLGLASFSSPSAIGIATTALSSPATTALIDTASVLSVSLYSGSLSSVTEAQMFNGANHFAYGADGRWEIIAAENCVMQGDGTYKLSNLLRGRFGTEWAMGNHIAGDMIVLLSPLTLQFIDSNINAIGVSKVYKAVTYGYSLDSAAGISLTYRGVNLKCLAPVYLNGDRHPTSNDWNLSWIRRTRIGGEWRDGVDATLGESSEAYEVDIYSSAAFATVKRTLTGLSSATAAYTSAQQVADFGSNQSTLYVKVYQLSAITGRGTALTASITR